MNKSMTLGPVPGRPILIDAGQVALARIADLVRQGAAPERVAYEVETIVSAWQAEAVRQPDAVRERLALCCDCLGAGVASAREQVEELGHADVAALGRGARSLAAMIAAQDAMSSACDVI
jgi:hypothetical protein